MGACKESCTSLHSILLCTPQNQGFAGGAVTRSSAPWEKGERRAGARAAVWEQPPGAITQGGGERVAGVSLLVGGEGVPGSSLSVVEKTHVCSASLNSSPSPQQSGKSMYPVTFRIPENFCCHFATWPAQGHPGWRSISPLVWKWVLLAAAYPPAAFLEGTVACDCPFTPLMPFITV